MKIAIIDDSAQERENGKAAVEVAGHEAIVIDPHKDLADQLPELNNAVKVLEDGGEVFEVPLHLSINQQGMSLVDALIALKVDAVVTDLYYNLSYGAIRHERHVPSGLLTAIGMVALNIPVVICTGGNGDHHKDDDINWIYDSYALATGSVAKKIGWNDGKNWTKAVKEAVERV